MGPLVLHSTGVCLIMPTRFQWSEAQEAWSCHRWTGAQHLDRGVLQSHSHQKHQQHVLLQRDGNGRQEHTANDCCVPFFLKPMLQKCVFSVTRKIKSCLSADKPSCLSALCCQYLKPAPCGLKSQINSRKSCCLPASLSP